jgi:hypothetical protein
MHRRIEAEIVADNERNRGKGFNLRPTDRTVQQGSSTPAIVITTDTTRLRKSNGNDFRVQDAPFVQRMAELIKEGKARSPEDAARAVINQTFNGKKVAGTANPESQVKRLAKLYRETIPAQPDQ